MHNPSPPSRRVPTSAISAFIEAHSIQGLIEPWVADAEDREFVARCMVQTGPAHHCGANYVLLRLLGRVLERVGGPPVSASVEATGTAIPLRLPPPFTGPLAETQFPLTLPTRAVTQLAAGHARHLAAMIDCLTDGPPQHALANAAMLHLIEAILTQLGDNLRETP